MTISSAATVSIASNDFSGVGANGIKAVGDPAATISLKNNYWGTTNGTQIGLKILENADDAARPKVDFTSPAQGISSVLAANASVVYGAADQIVTLTANVSNPNNDVINEGFVTFAVLAGASVIGLPVKSTVVANNKASVVYTVPGGTPVATYTIQAVYDDAGGPNNYVGNADLGHQLRVVTGATKAALAAVTAVTFSPSAVASIPVSASITLTNASGTVDSGSVTFTISRFGVAAGSPITVPISVVERGDRHRDRGRTSCPPARPRRAIRSWPPTTARRTSPGRPTRRPSRSTWPPPSRPRRTSRSPSTP